LVQNVTAGDVSGLYYQMPM